MPDVQLRLTDTNSATDSEGAVWGINAALFGLVLLAALASVGLWLLLWGRTAWSVTPTGILSALPFTLAVAYALFKQSHPPGYDLDLIEYWICGPAFGPVEPEREPENPSRVFFPAVMSSDHGRTDSSTVSVPQQTAAPSNHA